MLRNLKPRKAEQIPVQKAEDSMPSAFFFSSGMNRANGEIPVLAASVSEALQGEADSRAAPRQWCFFLGIGETSVRLRRLFKCLFV